MESDPMYLSSIPNRNETIPLAEQFVKFRSEFSRFSSISRNTLLENEPILFFCNQSDKTFSNNQLPYRAGPNNQVGSTIVDPLNSKRITTEPIRGYPITKLKCWIRVR